VPTLEICRRLVVDREVFVFVGRQHYMLVPVMQSGEVSTSVRKVIQ
jgi:hypothetical protein